MLDDAERIHSGGVHQELQNRAPDERVTLLQRDDEGADYRSPSIRAELRSAQRESIAVGSVAEGTWLGCGTLWQQRAARE